MFKNLESWIVKAADGEHRVEMEYLILTGELRLRLDGREIRNWPGGVIAGTRLSANHAFTVGGASAVFDAGLFKLNRYFRLTVDGQPVKAEPSSIPVRDLIGAALLAAAFVLIALLGIVFMRK